MSAQKGEKSVIKRVVKRIHVKKMGGWGFFYKVPGLGNAGRSTLEEVVGRLPTKSYRVEYRLANNGRYHVSRQLLQRRGAQAIVCFLPDAWNGRHVSRRVLPW